MTVGVPDSVPGWGSPAGTGTGTGTGGSSRAGAGRWEVGAGLWCGGVGAKSKERGLSGEKRFPAAAAAAGQGVVVGAFESAGGRGL